MTKHMFAPTRRLPHLVPIKSTRKLHRVEAARWALSQGLPMSRDALAVIVSTRPMNPDGTVCTTWTTGTVAELIGWRSAAWCSTRGVPEPIHLVESLISYLDYLASTRILSERSDPVEDLIDELHDLAQPAEFDPVHRTDTSGHWPIGQSARNRDEARRSGMLIQLIPKKSSIAARPS